MNVFAGNSLFQLIHQSDFMSKMVLLVLLFMSIACWAIFLCKVALFLLKNRQLKCVVHDMKDIKTMKGLIDLTSYHKNTAPGYFLSKNLVFFKNFVHGTSVSGFDSNDWEQIQRYTDQTLDAVLAFEESYVSFLSTSAAVAPLLGLFGTVWGLIHSFMRIAEKQVADINTVAPGIAEALITTLAGLIVAIPAFVMFNYVQNKIRVIEQGYTQLADQLLFVVYYQSKGKKDDTYAQTSSAAAYEPTDRYFTDTAD